MWFEILGSKSFDDKSVQGDGLHHHHVGSHRHPCQMLWIIINQTLHSNNMTLLQTLVPLQAPCAVLGINYASLTCDQFSYV